MAFIYSETAGRVTNSTANLGVGGRALLLFAFFCVSLAASRGLAKSAKLRDVVARYMTPAQIAEAQRMAREWRAKFQEARKKVKEAASR